jgi:hypothetical protein
MVNTQQDNKLRKIRSLSYLLDESIPIPGTAYRIGLDPILGLIPGAGDYLGAILSLYIIYESAKLGVSKPTLSRMVFNIVFESLLGTVPVLGDLFDAGYKSNKKNLELLETHLKLVGFNTVERASQTEPQIPWKFIIIVSAIVLLFLLITTGVTIFILTLLFRAVTGG